MRMLFGILIAWTLISNGIGLIVMVKPDSRFGKLIIEKSLYYVACVLDTANRIFNR